MSETTATSERQAFSSVEITKNAKGAYQWTVKTYCAIGDEQIALLKARVLDEQLTALYAAPESKEASNDTD